MQCGKISVMPLLDSKRKILLMIKYVDIAVLVLVLKQLMYATHGIYKTIMASEPAPYVTECGNMR